MSHEQKIVPIHNIIKGVTALQIRYYVCSYYEGGNDASA